MKIQKPTLPELLRLAARAIEQNEKLAVYDACEKAYKEKVLPHYILIQICGALSEIVKEEYIGISTIYKLDLCEPSTSILILCLAADIFESEGH